MPEPCEMQTVDTRTTLAGGTILFIEDFLAEIRAVVRKRRVAIAAVPEEFPLVRTLQFAANYWPLTEAAAAQQRDEADKRRP